MTAPDKPRQSLGVVATRGMFWTGGGQLLRQGVQLVSSVVLARLLAPNDFGLFTMALVVIGLGQLFADFGVGAAIVQSQTTSRIVLSSCFWANLAVGTVLALLISIASPLVAGFYQHPNIASLVIVASASLVLSAAIVVPRAMLYREMQFASLAKAQFFGSVSGAIAAIGFAWVGFGVWSLVVQPLVGSAVTLVLSTYYANWLPRTEFSWSGIRGLARFSAGVLGSDLLNYANRNADSLLIGRVLGSGPLGFYSLSYQIMLYPLQQVSSVIVRVLFPTLSRMQDDLPRFRDAYLKSISAIALVTFPMMIGLYGVADDFVLVVLGQKWLPTLPLLRILVWVGMMQSIATTVGTIYLSTGNIRRLFQVTLAGTPMLIGGILVGLQWGIEGVAIGYAAASFSLFYLSLTIAGRLAGLRLADFHRALVRPLVAAVTMLMVLLVSHGFVQSLAPPMRLGVLVAIGAIVYVGMSFLVNNAQIRAMMVLARAAVRKS